VNFSRVRLGKGAFPSFSFSEKILGQGVRAALGMGLSSISAGISETYTYIDLSPTSSGFYSLISAFSPTGNYTLEIDMQSANGLGIENGVLFGSSSNSSTFIGILSSGNVFIRSNNDSKQIAIPAPFLNSQKLIKFKAVHVDDTVTVSLSGTVIGSVSQDRFPDIGVIGSYAGGANSFKGVLSKPRLIDDVTPANSMINFNLDELTQNYELPDDNVYGPELWDYGVIDADGTTNQFSVIAGDFTGNYDDDGLYEVLVTWENLTGKIRFNAGNNNYTVGAVSNDTGSASFVFKFLAGTTGRLNVTEIMPDDGDGTTADSITMSVRKVSAFVEYQNIPEDVRDTYTLIDADYLGSELIFGVIPNSIASGWTDNGNGLFTADGTNTNTVPIQWFTANTETGISYSIVFKVIATNGVEAWTRIGDDESSRNTSVGEYTTTLTSTGGNANVNIRSLSNFVGTISLSVKRKIEVAQ
jgi:hypothetical protein